MAVMVLEVKCVDIPDSPEKGSILSVAWCFVRLGFCSFFV